jgi:DNA replication and repair protein RecF
MRVSFNAQPRSIDRLRLSDFRNYGAVEIAAGPGLVVVSGDNGAGKTNLLEAISLLAPGRGLRRASLAELPRDGGAAFAVHAELGCGEAPPVPLATGMLADAPTRRQVRVNGAATSANALAEWLSVLWLTPAMDRLFVEAAGGRRRFLDRLTLALEPGHAQHSQRYDAAMQARNRLLGAERSPDPDWLAALERQMAVHGEAVTAARRRTVETMTGAIAAALEGPFPRAGLALSDDHGVLAEVLRQNRRADAAAGRATAGPHRTDLVVSHLAKRQPAVRASTGEQKALLIGLVLAHARAVARLTGRKPILLLDEIVAHLDETRRVALFSTLASDGGQVWMTGTDRTLFDAIGSSATYIEIARGDVARN